MPARTGEFFVDASGHVERLDEVAAALLGLSAWRVAGRAFREVALAIGAPSLADAVAAIAAGAPDSPPRRWVLTRRAGPRELCVEIGRAPTGGTHVRFAA